MVTGMRLIPFPFLFFSGKALSPNKINPCPDFNHVWLTFLYVVCGLLYGVWIGEWMVAVVRVFSPWTTETYMKPFLAIVSGYLGVNLKILLLLIQKYVTSSKSTTVPGKHKVQHDWAWHVHIPTLSGCKIVPYDNPTDERLVNAFRKSEWIWLYFKNYNGIGLLQTWSKINGGLKSSQYGRTKYYRSSSYSQSQLFEAWLKQS